MEGTKFVTGLVILSLVAGVGCRAKFTTKNKPASPSAGANGGIDSGTPTGPVKQTPSQPGGYNPPSGKQPPVATVPPGGQPSTGHPGYPPKGNPTVNQPPVILPPEPKRPACQTGADSSIDKNRVIQQKTIVFKRGRQMVWRKNCDGQVVSKRYENISGNTMKALVIKPVGGQGPMSIYNRTTCHATTKQTAIAGAPNGEYRFTVSTQKTDHAMYVRPGVNYIDYQIGSELGTLILTVRIDETEDDCIVINAKGCAPKREAHWSDDAFSSN